MVKFSSYATAAICTVGLAVAVFKPTLQLPAAAPLPVQAAAPEAAIGEPGTVIGDLPVSVVVSNFDLETTDSSQFGDLDQQ